MAYLRGRRDRMCRRMMSGSSVNRSSPPWRPADDDVDEDEEEERDADAEGEGGRERDRSAAHRDFFLCLMISLSLSLASFRSSSKDRGWEESRGFHPSSNIIGAVGTKWPQRIGRGFTSRVLLPQEAAPDDPITPGLMWLNLTRGTHACVTQSFDENPASLLPISKFMDGEPLKEERHGLNGSRMGNAGGMSLNFSSLGLITWSFPLACYEEHNANLE
ncbi:hypothetical protein C4D60_Mb05t28010 [Musa balbisiana]|uniref:Uncharacterized protein n=1 Tax=Musa balbisiana TaxID=52838 RepID=A0A4S8JZF7_MUSBA|nr:hypothetical protein C4D60_Mb05t28010 [Musa balbisiana]